jgi:hypothetical protein
MWLLPPFIWTHNQQQEEYKDYQQKKEIDLYNQYSKHKKFHLQEYLLKAFGSYE